MTTCDLLMANDECKGLTSNTKNTQTDQGQKN